MKGPVITAELIVTLRCVNTAGSLAVSVSPKVRSSGSAEAVLELQIQVTKSRAVKRRAAEKERYASISRIPRWN